MSVNVDVGPIDYLALEFPGARLTGEGMAELVRLVDAGVIRVLDMRGLVRDADGTVTAVAITDLDGDGTLDLAIFEGVESDLLDEEDLAAAADLVQPGNAVAVLVYENTWAGPFVSAMRRAGAEVVASVRLPADAVIARLEALEAASGRRRLVGRNRAPAGRPGGWAPRTNRSREGGEHDGTTTWRGPHGRRRRDRDSRVQPRVTPAGR